MYPAGREAVAGAARACAAWLRARAPRRCPEWAFDLAAAAHALCWRAWLAAAEASVWADPLGRARAPIRVAVGRARAPAVVCLVAGRTPAELRVASFFWRTHPECTRPALAALAARHGVARGRFALAGAVVFPAPRGALPLAFRLELDLEAGTVAVTHARAGPAAGPAECAHGPAPIRMNAVGLGDLLEPLLGAARCPAAVPCAAAPPR